MFPALKTGATLRAALCILLAAVPAAAQAPRPGVGSSRRPVVPPEESPQRPPTPEQVGVDAPVFEFHSGFWMNLHHFLYQQSREKSSDRRAAPAGGAEAWGTALDYYARNLADRDLLFNRDMVNIKNRLAELEGCPDLSGTSGPQCAAGLRPELVNALETAAPVYRAHWWPEHDRVNREWVAAVAPVIRSLGRPVAEKLSAVYAEKWPAERLRVDMTYVSIRVSAYTTLGPAHITVGSADSRNQGQGALETLFHEASHTLATAVRDGIARECRARNKPIPRDLWHALLFYTTGEVVRLAYAEQARGAGSSLAGYLPYAQREGLYSRGWEGYLALIERYWQPYLDGKVAFDRALARLAAAL